MKGIFNKRPPLPRYTQTLKVHQVTTYLEGLGDNAELCYTIIKKLSRKLVFLLALTSSERGSELILLYSKLTHHEVLQPLLQLKEVYQYLEF